MFKMKESKVRGLGYSRYVSLPKAWIENSGLSIGDSVKIWLNKNGNLEIAPVTACKQETGAASTPVKELPA